MTQRAREVDFRGVVVLRGVYRGEHRSVPPLGAGFIMVLENPSRPEPLPPAPLPVPAQDGTDMLEFVKKFGWPVGLPENIARCVDMILSPSSLVRHSIVFEQAMCVILIFYFTNLIFSDVSLEILCAPYRISTRRKLPIATSSPKTS